MRDEKGITLAALVITIIVLIIIASIATYSAVGTVNYAKYSKAKSEFEIVQTNVNSWYEEYKNVKTVTGETKEEKQQQLLSKYGVATTDSSCNQTNLTKTATATGITATDYRFLSGKYIKENLGLDDSFEFLINIPTRTVILFGGLTYNGKTYYTAEDFGILNVQGSVALNSITFNVEQRYVNNIAISNLTFKDTSNENMNVSKFRVLYSKANAEAWTDVTNKLTKYTENNSTKYSFDVPSDGNYDIKVTTSDNSVSSNKSTVAVKKIEVGDYITYIPPTNQDGTKKVYHLPNSVSGNTTTATEQTLEQEYNLWRVLNVNNGTIDMMPAFKKTELPSGEDYTNIYFKDAEGWNNAPYLMDDMSRVLYENKDKGITARSIDYEDIYNLMKDGSEGNPEVDNDGTGKGKISEYQKKQVKALSEGTYIDDVDKVNYKTVTYKIRTSYPVLWQEVRNSLSSRYYSTDHPYSETVAAANGKIGTNPDTLTVDYTYYAGTINDTKDFLDATKHNVIFGTGTTYFLASRCVICFSSLATFGLRYVNISSLNVRGLYDSYGTASNDSYRAHVCPVVTLKSNVKVKVSSTASTRTTPHTVDLSD